MKVLIQSRENLFTMPGGDTIQLVKTKEALETMGVIVEISTELDPDVSEFDVVHLSNLTRVHETYVQMKNAKMMGKPIVLSTIFWPMEEYELKSQTGIRKVISKRFSRDNRERIKIVAKIVLGRQALDKASLALLTKGYYRLQKEVCANVDVFLPNASLEMAELNKYLGSNYTNFIVVPNAIDSNIATGNSNEQLSNKFKKFQGYTICVGRIEPRKNQYNLLRALSNSSTKLLLVGAPPTVNDKYFLKVKELVDQNPNFSHIEKIKNEELYQLFKMCKTSVLPSWLDTPGLVSIEAGVMGCNLAVSEIGTTKEYFGDFAEYCLPDDLDSIRVAVENCNNKEQNPKLREHILENFTWDIAATKTMEAYRKVIGDISL